MRFEVESKWSEFINGRNYIVVDARVSGDTIERCLVVSHQNGYAAVIFSESGEYRGFPIEGRPTEYSFVVEDGVSNNLLQRSVSISTTRALRSAITREGRDCCDICIYTGDLPQSWERWLAANGYIESASEAENDSETESSESADGFISDHYDADTTYKGIHSYHFHHDCLMNQPTIPFRGHRIGVELEVEFYNEDDRDDFSDIGSNWFYLERDGSLNEFGCEIITIPILPKDAKDVEFWKPLTSYLSTRARSWDTNTCGLHVHIGREILGRTDEQRSETLGRLLYLYHHYVKDTRLNIKIYGREYGYHDHDGKTDVGGAAKTIGGDVFKLKDLSTRIKNASISKSNEGRYFDINIQNDRTIEFRKGRGSLKANRIAMVVEYSERMCIYAKNTPWSQISYDDFVCYLKATASNPDLKAFLDRYY